MEVFLAKSISLLLLLAAVCIVAWLWFPAKIKTVFITMTVAASITACCIFAVRIPGLELASIKVLFHSIWFSSSVALLLLLQFLSIFAKPHWFNEGGFWLGLGPLFGLIVLLAADYLIGGLFVSGVSMHAGAPRPVYGGLNWLYFSLMGLYLLIGLVIFARTTVRTGNEIIKYQMQRILLAFSAGLVGFFSTNIAYPFLTGRTGMADYGPFSLVLCVGGVAWVIVRSRHALVLKALEPVLQKDVGSSTRLDFGRNYLALKAFGQFVSGSRPGESLELQFNTPEGSEMFRLQHGNPADTRQLADLHELRAAPPAILGSLVRENRELKEDMERMQHQLRSVERAWALASAVWNGKISTKAESESAGIDDISNVEFMAALVSHLDENPDVGALFLDLLSSENSTISFSDREKTSS